MNELQKELVNGAKQKEQNTIHVNPLKYPSILCDKCGCETFVPAYVFKKIPGVAIGYAGQDVTTPIEVYICSKCGELMPEYKAPKEDDINENKTKLII